MNSRIIDGRITNGCIASGRIMTSCIIDGRITNGCITNKPYHRRPHIKQRNSRR